MALRRMAARETLAQLSKGGSYDNAALTRLMQDWKAPAESGDSPDAASVKRLRDRAWDLYRNNPHVRKIVNSTVAKIVGRGLFPEPLVDTRDGKPDDKTRSKIADDFREWAQAPMLIGRPGEGGVDLQGFQEQAVREAGPLSGEVLVRFHSLSDSEAARRGMVVPLALELIEAERLVEEEFGVTKQAKNNIFFRGIEMDRNGRRLAYWIYDHNPHTPVLFQQHQLVPRRIPANEILHVYCADRPSQMRGVCGLSPVLGQLRDAGDFQENELQSSALAACISLVVHEEFGPVEFHAKDGADSSDADGNKFDRLQPRTILHLKNNERATVVNPSRVNGNVEAFANHQLRVLATGVPGMKASTVTGDYRNSSFSSERAADNDCWPEIEQKQQWIISNLMQPIYRRWIEAAWLAGRFDGRVANSADISRLAKAQWSAPVLRSINPVDDVTAAVLRITHGLSSPIVESGALGRNWMQNIEDVDKVLREARSISGLPPEYIDNLIGITPAAPKPQKADGPQQPSGEIDPGQKPNGRKLSLVEGRMNGYHG
jgi:lambda family phage portal protein